MFQALFIDNPSRHPIVILKDVTFADLRTMVDFMYYGEVNVTEEQLPQVRVIQFFPAYHRSSTQKRLEQLPVT